MDRLALRIGRLCGSEDCRLEGFVDRLYGLEGSVGRLCESEDSTDWKTLLIGRLGSDVGLVRNSPTPIAWFVEACFSPGCVDPVLHIPPGRHVPPSGGKKRPFGDATK